MGLFGKSDPFVPGAYVNDGRVLYEIVGRENGRVMLLNCVTEWTHDVPVGELLGAVMGACPWKLTKAAPAVPDGLESD
jgi:hypothetical protein